MSRRKQASTTTYAPCTAAEGHLWILPTPDGGPCVGTCQRCGEEREFSNSLSSVGWMGLNARQREQAS